MNKTDMIRYTDEMNMKKSNKFCQIKSFGLALLRWLDEALIETSIQLSRIYIYDVTQKR